MPERNDTEEQRMAVVPVASAFDDFITHPGYEFSTGERKLSRGVGQIALQHVKTRSNYHWTEAGYRSTSNSQRGFLAISQNQMGAGRTLGGCELRFGQS